MSDLTPAFGVRPDPGFLVTPAFSTCDEAMPAVRLLLEGVR